MFNKQILLIVFLCFLGLLSCQKNSEPTAQTANQAPTDTSTPKTRLQMSNKTDYQGPTRIEVQHILISFEGSLPGKKVSRSQKDAKSLAAQLLERSKKEDFDALVKQYTDDRVPGVYSMANTGVKPKENEFPRGQMVSAFGDVGFQLKVGEIGLASYDKKKSPFGFHIIKRLK